MQRLLQRGGIRSGHEVVSSSLTVVVVGHGAVYEVTGSTPDDFIAGPTTLTTRPSPVHPQTRYWTSLPI